MNWSGRRSDDPKLRFAGGKDSEGRTFESSHEVAELRSDRLRKVFEIWETKRLQADQLPADSEFDILDYRVAMGQINYIKVQRDPLDFIFRVHSVSGSSYIGKDLTGRSVDDYPESQYAAFVRSAFEKATSAREPQIVIENMFMTENRMLRWEGMILPLQNDSGEVGHLVVAFEVFQ